MTEFVRKHCLFGASLTALATVWTALVINYSARVGRLAHEATYDDCMFMFDGWWRLELMDREGLFDALASFFRVFPHSPWNSLQSFVAFQIFGVTDMAPYWFHAVPMFLFLLGVAYLCRGLPLHFRIGTLFLALSFQFTFTIIYELRPDPFYALIVAVGVLWGVVQSCQKGIFRKQDLMISYGLLAFSIYLKPTFFLNSIFLAGVFTLSIIAISFVHPGIRNSLSPVEKGAAKGWYAPLLPFCKVLWAPVLIFAAVSLPLFLLHFEYFYEYLVRNAFGSETNIWKLEGGITGAFHFFTIGWGGRQMMGTSIHTATFLLIAGLIPIVMRRNFVDLIFIGWMLFMTGAALFVMLVGQLNGPYFGLTFHFLYFFTALAALVQGISALPKTKVFRAGAALLMMGALLFNISHYRTFTGYPRFENHQRVFGIAHKQHGIAGDILDALEAEMRVPERPGQYTSPEVFVTFSGAISAGSLRWMAAKRDWFGVFSGFDRNELIEDYERALERAQWVLTAEEGVPEMFLYLPTVRLHGAVHDRVAAHPDFEQVSHFPTYTGASIFLFRRQ